MPIIIILLILVVIVFVLAIVIVIIIITPAEVQVAMVSAAELWDLIGDRAHPPICPGFSTAPDNSPMCNPVTESYNRKLYLYF